MNRTSVTSSTTAPVLTTPGLVPAKALGRVERVLAVGLALGLWTLAAVATSLPAPTVSEALALAREAAAAVAPPDARIEVKALSLDSRLKLAPCEHIQPYLRAGVSAWGRTRVGLRCERGIQTWNVSLPVEVQVWAPAVVASTTLPAGTTLDAGMLRIDVVDWATSTTRPHEDSDKLVGRTLARPLAAGQALRAPDLQVRQWFKAGEIVQVDAIGAGFRVASKAQALGPGLEDRPVRVRTEQGKMLTGRAVGERRVEVAL